MSDAISAYEKARRSGGHRPLHPETEKNLGISKPSLLEKIMESKITPWIFTGLAILAAFYAYNVSTSKSPTQKVADDVKKVEQVIDEGLPSLIVQGFEGVNQNLLGLSSDIKELIYEIKADREAKEVTPTRPTPRNPDVPIVSEKEPQVIVKWKTKWRTKWKTKTVPVENPVNARLQSDNAALKAEVNSLKNQIRNADYNYKLSQKIINDFYTMNKDPRFKYKLTHPANCEPRAY